MSLKREVFYSSVLSVCKKSYITALCALGVGVAVLVASPIQLPDPRVLEAKKIINLITQKNFDLLQRITLNTHMEFYVKMYDTLYGGFDNIELRGLRSNWVIHNNMPYLKSKLMFTTHTSKLPADETVYLQIEILQGIMGSKLLKWDMFSSYLTTPQSMKRLKILLPAYHEQLLDNFKNADKY